MKFKPFSHRTQLGILLTTGGLMASSIAFGQSTEVNIICSAQAAWCSMIAVTFEKSQGVKVNMTMKGSGEAIAQIMAEKANPKTDVWFGGTGDPHLQAAEQNLTLEYKSPTLPRLHDWAQQQAKQSGYKQLAFTLVPWALVTTPSCWPRKNWPFPKLGMTCSSLNTKAKFNLPIQPPAVRPTP
jgi:iron(III) transport system substrate-binding protein